MVLDGLLFNKRVTYVIDPNGIIAKIYPNVEPASHAIELLQDIKNLSK